VLRSLRTRGASARSTCAPASRSAASPPLAQESDPAPASPWGSLMIWIDKLYIKNYNNDPITTLLTRGDAGAAARGRCLSQRRAAGGDRAPGWASCERPPLRPSSLRPPPVAGPRRDPRSDEPHGNGACGAPPERKAPARRRGLAVARRHRRARKPATQGPARRRGLAVSRRPPAAASRQPRRSAGPRRR
jgi:hypothetical protein